MHIREGLLVAYLRAVDLVLAAREVRPLLERNSKALITISYPQRDVQVPRGWTVLITSARRQRCCRVIITTTSR